MICVCVPVTQDVHVNADVFQIQQSFFHVLRFAGQLDNLCYPRTIL